MQSENWQNFRSSSPCDAGTFDKCAHWNFHCRVPWLRSVTSHGRKHDFSTSLGWSLRVNTGNQREPWSLQSNMGVLVALPINQHLKCGEYASNMLVWLLKRDDPTIDMLHVPWRTSHWTIKYVWQSKWICRLAQVKPHQQEIGSNTLFRSLILNPSSCLKAFRWFQTHSPSSLENVQDPNRRVARYWCDHRGKNIWCHPGGPQRCFLNTHLLRWWGQ